MFDAKREIIDVGHVCVDIISNNEIRFGVGGIEFPSKLSTKKLHNSRDSRRLRLEGCLFCWLDSKARDSPLNKVLEKVAVIRG